MINRRSFLGAGAGVAAVSGLSLTASGVARARPRTDGKWEALRRGIGGDVVLPGDADYVRAKQLAAAQFDHLRPQAVVYCQSPRDVRTAMAFAQDHDIASAVRSGGHSFVGWSGSEGVVIDLSRLNGVRASANTVRLGPGAQAVDVLGALTPHGMGVPAGFCPTVCPGGFVTGGGMGWQFRKYGPTSDRLVSAQVVLADGRTVTASEHQHQDLLWALRGGGGGNFGVVTDFELAPTHEPHVVTFDLTWPWEQAERVLSGWQQWAAHTPANLAPRAGVLLKDAAPGAVPVVMVSGAHFGEQSELETLLAELTSLAGSSPATSVVQDRPYDKAMMRLFGCEGDSLDQCHVSGANPEALLPRTAWVKHRSRMFAEEIPGSGIAGMLQAFDANRRAGQYRWLGFLSLGKNANDVAADATAYVHRDAELFAVFTAGLNTPAPAADELAPALAWSDSAFGSMDRYSNGRTYVNYPDQGLADWETAYYGSNLARLKAVKRRYDPHGFFRFPHAVRG
ncbi:FAD-binding oxidoreductase [Streptomyces sp. NBC_00388]|uniref:FAD-binding oxidoreductase n=1 Tax=Streptomyces sp. NBC_00388 TaxID=2975735 RepID=UPI002E1F7811